jgi:hypothetical protein
LVGAAGFRPAAPWRRRPSAGREPLRALRDNDVRGFVAGGLLSAGVAERRQIETCQQMFSRAEKHRDHGQVHLVDEPRLQILSNGGHASAEADVLSTGSSEGLIQGAA